MGSFVKVGSQTAANEQQRGTFVEVSTGKEIERNQEPAHSSPVVSKTTSSPVKSGVSKKEISKDYRPACQKDCRAAQSPEDHREEGYPCAGQEDGPFRLWL